MLINKNRYQISRDRKLMHKVGKQWVVVSAFVLALLGAKGAKTMIHASSTQTPDQQVTNQMNQRLQRSQKLVKQQNGPQSAAAQNNNVQTNVQNSQSNGVQGATQASSASNLSTRNIMQAAHNLHTQVMAHNIMNPQSTTDQSRFSQANYDQTVQKPEQNSLGMIHNLGGADNVRTGTYDGLTYKYDTTTQSLEFTGGTINASDTLDFLNNTQFGGSYSYHNSDYNYDYNDSDNSTIDSIDRYNSDDFPYYQNKNLKSVTFDSDVDFSHVNNMHGMFEYDWALQSINLPKSINTSNVTNMKGMFKHDSSLVSLTIPDHFDASHVTDMNEMFKEDSDLKTLNLPTSFNTDNVEDMGRMFEYDVLSDKVMNNVLSHLNVSHVINMDDMFYSESGLNSLTIPNSFNPINVTSMGSMFSNDRSLAHLNLPGTFNTGNVGIMSDMFSNDDDLSDGAMNSILSHLTTGNVITMNGMLSNDDGLNKLVIPNNFDTRQVRDMAYMFDGDNELNSLSLPESFNTANVTNMSYMFNSDDELNSLSLPESFNTSNVTDMSYMFNSTSFSDSSMEKIIGKLNVNNVVDMNYMFHDDGRLQNLVVPNTFNTRDVKTTIGMFSDDDFQSLTLPPSFSVQNDKSMRNMFSSNNNLATLNLPNNFGPNVAGNMAEMFRDDNSLSDKEMAAILSHLKTDQVTDMDGMLQSDDGLHSLSIPNTFNTANVTKTGGNDYFSDDDEYYNDGMFENDTNLQTLTLPASFDMKNNEDMSDMFESDGSLKALNLPSNFGPSVNSSMDRMFMHDGSLSDQEFAQILDKLKVDTVSDMNSMFESDRGLTTLTIPSTFAPKNVRYMASMFRDDPALKGLNLPSNFGTNTSMVSSIDSMLRSDNALSDKAVENILSHFNTSNLNNMPYVLASDNGLKSLTIPDNINTVNVSDMNGAFKNDTALQKLTLSKNFDTRNVTSMDNMFYNDLNNLTIQSPDTRFNDASRISHPYPKEWMRLPKRVRYMYERNASSDARAYIYDDSDFMNTETPSDFITDVFHMYNNQVQNNNSDVKKYKEPVSELEAPIDAYGLLHAHRDINDYNKVNQDLDNALYNLTPDEYQMIMYVFKNNVATRPWYKKLVQNGYTSPNSNLASDTDHRGTYVANSSNIPFETIDYVYNGKTVAAQKIDDSKYYDKSRSQYDLGENLDITQAPFGYQLDHPDNVIRLNGNVHQIGVEPAPAVDTIDYQYDGHAVASAKVHGLYGLELTVTNHNDPGMPQNYQLVKADQTFKYNDGKHVVPVEPELATDTINYQYNGQTVDKQTLTGSDVDVQGANFTNFLLNNAEVPKGYRLADSNQLYNYDGQTYNVKVLPNQDTAELSYVVNGTDNTIANGVITGDANEVVDPTKQVPVPKGYHTVRSQNTYHFTSTDPDKLSNNPSDKIYVQGNQVKGTATIDLVYERSNGQIDFTKSVQVPINSVVGSNVMIDPMKYTQVHYSPVSSIWSMSLNGSIAPNGANLNYNPTHTFIYQGAKADANIAYVNVSHRARPLPRVEDTGNGSDYDRDAHRSTIYNGRRDPVVGHQVLSDLGVYGQAVNLTSQDAKVGTHDMIAPRGYHFINKNYNLRKLNSSTSQDDIPQNNYQSYDGVAGDYTKDFFPNYDKTWSGNAGTVNVTNTRGTYTDWIYIRKRKHRNYGRYLGPGKYLRTGQIHDWQKHSYSDSDSDSDQSNFNYEYSQSARALYIYSGTLYLGRDYRRLTSNDNMIQSLKIGPKVHVITTPNMMLTFSNDPRLKSLALPSTFNTSHVYYMAGMFANDPHLLTLILPASFSTRSVRGIFVHGFLSMFRNDHHLRTLILPEGFKSYRTSYRFMFRSDVDLQTLVLPPGFANNIGDSPLFEHGMFYKDHNLRRLTITSSRTRLNNTGISYIWHLASNPAVTTRLHGRNLEGTWIRGHISKDNVIKIPVAGNQESLTIRFIDQYGNQIGSDINESGAMGTYFKLPETGPKGYTLDSDQPIYKLAMSSDLDPKDPNKLLPVTMHVTGDRVKVPVQYKLTNGQNVGNVVTLSDQQIGSTIDLTQKGMPVNYMLAPGHGDPKHHLLSPNDLASSNNTVMLGASESTPDTPVAPVTPPAPAPIIPVTPYTPVNPEPEPTPSNSGIPDSHDTPSYTETKTLPVYITPVSQNLTINYVDPDHNAFLASRIVPMVTSGSRVYLDNNDVTNNNGNNADSFVNQDDRVKGYQVEPGQDVSPIVHLTSASNSYPIYTVKMQSRPMMLHVTYWNSDVNSKVGSDDITQNNHGRSALLGDTFTLPTAANANQQGLKKGYTLDPGQPSIYQAHGVDTVNNGRIIDNITLLAHGNRVVDHVPVTVDEVDGSGKLQRSDVIDVPIYGNVGDQIIFNSRDLQDYIPQGYVIAGQNNPYDRTNYINHDYVAKMTVSDVSRGYWDPNSWQIDHGSNYWDVTNQRPRFVIQATDQKQINVNFINQDHNKVGSTSFYGSYRDAINLQDPAANHQSVLSGKLPAGYVYGQNNPAAQTYGQLSRTVDINVIGQPVTVKVEYDNPVNHQLMGSTDDVDNTHRVGDVITLPTTHLPKGYVIADPATLHYQIVPSNGPIVRHLNVTARTETLPVEFIDHNGHQLGNLNYQTQGTIGQSNVALPTAPTGYHYANKPNNGNTYDFTADQMDPARSGFMQTRVVYLQGDTETIPVEFVDQYGHIVPNGNVTKTGQMGDQITLPTAPANYTVNNGQSDQYILTPANVNTPGHMKPVKIYVRTNQKYQFNVIANEIVGGKMIGSVITPIDLNSSDNESHTYHPSRYQPVGFAIENGDQPVTTEVTDSGLSVPNVTWNYDAKNSKDATNANDHQDPQPLLVTYHDVDNGHDVVSNHRVDGLMDTQLDVTNPTDGGIAVPNGYALNAGQKLIHQITTDQQPVTLNVHGIHVGVNEFNLNIVREHHDGTTLTTPQQVTEGGNVNTSFQIKPTDYVPAGYHLDTVQHRASDQLVNGTVKTGGLTPNRHTFYYVASQVGHDGVQPINVTYYDDRTGQSEGTNVINNGYMDQTYNVSQLGTTGLKPGYSVDANQNQTYQVGTHSVTAHVMVHGNASTDQNRDDTVDVQIYKEDPYGNILAGQPETVYDVVTGNVGDAYNVNAKDYLPSGYQIDPNKNGDRDLTGTIRSDGSVDHKDVKFYYMMPNQSENSLKPIHVMYENDADQNVIADEVITPMKAHHDYNGKFVNVVPTKADVNSDNQQTPVPQGYVMDSKQDTRAGFSNVQPTYIDVLVHDDSHVQFSDQFSQIENFYDGSQLVKTSDVPQMVKGVDGQSFTVGAPQTPIGYTSATDNPSKVTGYIRGHQLTIDNASYRFDATNSANYDHPSDHHRAQPLLVTFKDGDVTVGQSDQRVDGYMNQTVNVLDNGKLKVPVNYRLASGDQLDYRITTNVQQPVIQVVPDVANNALVEYKDLNTGDLIAQRSVDSPIGTKLNQIAGDYTSFVPYGYAYSGRVSWNNDTTVNDNGQYDVYVTRQNYRTAPSPISDANVGRINVEYQDSSGNVVGLYDLAQTNGTSFNVADYTKARSAKGQMPNNFSNPKIIAGGQIKRFIKGQAQTLKIQVSAKQQLAMAHIEYEDAKTHQMITKSGTAQLLSMPITGRSGGTVDYTPYQQFIPQGYTYYGMGSHDNVLEDGDVDILMVRKAKLANNQLGQVNVTYHDLDTGSDVDTVNITGLTGYPFDLDYYENDLPMGGYDFAGASQNSLNFDNKIQNVTINLRKQKPSSAPQYGKIIVRFVKADAGGVSSKVNGNQSTSDDLFKEIKVPNSVDEVMTGHIGDLFNPVIYEHNTPQGTTFDHIVKGNNISTITRNPQEIWIAVQTINGQF